MPMKTFLKRLTGVSLGLGISLIGVSTALAGNLTWSADQTVDLSSPDINLTILSGSNANSLNVDAGSVAVAVANGESFSIRSSSRDLSVSGRTTSSVSNTCAADVATVTITGGADSETITITPTGSSCSTGSTSSGGGGGGGGGKASDKDEDNQDAPPKVPGSAHPTGTVFKTLDGTVWFITPDGQRRAFTSAGAFLSYGFLNFSSVVAATEDDLKLPQGSFIPAQDGKLICSDRDDAYAKKGTCYLITNGKRAAFTSQAVFNALGFKFSQATTGDVSFMPTDVNISSSKEAHRPGVLINNNGTIQLVGPNSLMGIPSESVFASWGYSFADVVPANTADKAKTQSGVMQSRVVGQLSPQ